MASHLKRNENGTDITRSKKHARKKGSGNGFIQKLKQTDPDWAADIIRANQNRKTHPAGFVITALLCLLLVSTLIIRNNACPPTPAVTSSPVEPVTTAEPVSAEEPEATPAYEEQSFVLSFIGDCTLNSGPNFLQSVHGYAAKMNGDYSYPFHNTVQYFEDDEFTFANLECTFSDKKLSSSEQFYFLCPTEYVNILTEGSVEFVTTANNHADDFGETGIESTLETLDTAGILHGKDGESQIVTTPNGLKIGVYTANLVNNKKTISEDIKTAAVDAVEQLKNDGAEYIVCAMHWGMELYYSPFDDMTDLAHRLIDAGADLVWGSHPHCLQPIEEYNDGIILYSAGNFSFGGNTRPSDPDTAVFQVTVKRGTDGSVTNDGINVVPCCVSSNVNAGNGIYDNYNDYCPTPYEEGSTGYGRTLSKLDGTYTPDKEGADYSNYYASWS